MELRIGAKNGCAACNHPVSMHVRRGCIAYDDSTEARCACPAEAASVRLPLRRIKSGAAA